MKRRQLKNKAEAIKNKNVEIRNKKEAIGLIE